MTKTVQVNCHWACGRVLALEFDHWPQRHELPADAVRFDIAWPDPAAEPRAMTAADMRYAAAHDKSCVGAFARARP